MTSEVEEVPRVERLEAQLKGVMECLAKSQQEVEALRAELANKEEAEAAVCPEDFGAVEYIKVLEKKLESLRAGKAVF